MSIKILKAFSKEIALSYARARTPRNYLGSMLFPKKTISSLDFKYVVGANNLPVMATVHSFNSEAEIASRDGLKRVSGEIALIKRKINVDEETIIRLETPREGSDEERDAIAEIYDDIDLMIDSVDARIEDMRMESIATGKVEIDENGVKATVDFGVSSDQKEILSGTSLWSDHDDAVPLDDMQEWAETAEDMEGIRPARSLTSRSVLSNLLQCEQIRAAIYGDNSTKRIITKDDLNSLMDRLELPRIETYNLKVRAQAANGTVSTKRFFPSHKFVMLPGDSLGNTLYGPTAESIRNKVKTSENNIFVQVYDTEDPVATWTKAVATAFPTFPAAGSIFIAEVLAEE